MTATTLRERQRQVREDMILDTAYDLLAARGYADMCMDDLAAQIGISKATLYQHFRSKEELAINVIVRLMRRTEAELAALDPALPAITRLERGLRHSLERCAGMWLAGPPLIPRSVLDHPRYQDQHQRVRRMLSGLIDEAKGAGDIPAHYPTPVVVQMITRLFQHDYLALLSEGAMTTEELCALLVAMVFDGIRARRSDAAAPAQTKELDHEP